MIVERASYNWAYSEDIPGSRCGPEDAQWPRPYQVLQEHEIWRELGFLARPQSTRLISGDASPPTVTHNSQTDNTLDGEAATQQREQQRVFRADSVNFQPSPNTKTQDRYVVTQLEVNGKLWTLTGVFDGHLGDATVEHVAHHLPVIIRDALKGAFEAITTTASNATSNPTRFVTSPSSTDSESDSESDTSSYLSGPESSPSSSTASVSPSDFHIPASSDGTLPSNPFSPTFISNLLKKSILNFDDAITNDVLGLFGGIDGLNDFTDAEIRSVINDQHRGGENWKRARLCMYGTTALLALVDPDYENLWVVNVGDCQAIMVSPTEQIQPKGGIPTAPKPLMKEWNVEVLTTMHNGDNDTEIERVQKLHPGEPECVVDRRVLGALAPFRCLGDVPFKQPPEFTRRILYNLFPGFQNTSPWEEFLVRNKTAPYVTAEAEVIHRRLAEPGAGDKKLEQERERRYLILCSDGFTDLCSEGQKNIIESWATGLEGSGCFDDDTDGSISPSSPPPSTKKFSFFGSPTKPGFGGIKAKVKAPNNLALRLLRRALGGEDRASVSRVLTLDMDQAWIDDTSIVVQTL